MAEPEFSTSFKSRFWSKVNKKGPIPLHRSELGSCWVWTACDVCGYGSIRLDAPSRKMIRSTHAAWMMEHGSIPDGLFALHHCDNPMCVRPSHLFLGTQRDNFDDMVRKDRQPFQKGRQFGGPECVARGDQHYTRLYPERVRRGQEVGNSVLTEAKVREILGLLSNGVPQALIGARFGVTQSMIGRIHRRIAWRHISADMNPDTNKVEDHQDH